MKKEKVLIGAGGSAREIKAHMKRFDLKCFVDDDYWVKNIDNIYPLSEFNSDTQTALITIGDSKKRFEIFNRMPKNTKYFTFIHPSAQIMSKDILIGEGTFIGANCIITCNVTIGNHCLINRSCHIGHDCFIGDYFSAMPGAIISGNVTIGSKVYLGTNSSIREKIKICDDVVVGLNSGVVKDIIHPGIYIGTPIKKMDKI